MDQVAAWKVACASVTGPGHIAEGGNCQDAHGLTINDLGCLVAVVSDGAGSTKYGGVAASLICDRLPSAIAESLVSISAQPCFDRRGLARIRKTIRQAVSNVRLSLLGLAVEKGISEDELLATLVGVAAHPNIGGIFFHIGDGAAVCFDEHGGEIALSPPENGAYVNTTYFLIEEGWKSRLRFLVFGTDFQTVFLMTDGVTDLSIARDAKIFRAFPAFFDPVAEFLSQTDRVAGEIALVEMLDSERSREKVDDDKTIVWAQVAKTHV